MKNGITCIDTARDKRKESQKEFMWVRVNGAKMRGRPTNKLIAMIENRVRDPVFLTARNKQPYAP